MFRTAELGQKLPKKEYKQIAPILHQELLTLQQELRDKAKTPVIIVFAGVDGAGKGATVKLLNEWMDTRWLINRAYRAASDEERERPEYWRFWRDLPPKGRIGLYMSSWYSQPVITRAYGDISEPEFDEHLDRIIAFENALAVDGALILKFWMHLSKPEQKKRLKSLEKDPLPLEQWILLKSLEKDPLLKWQVREKDWQHWRLYDEFIGAAERLIMRTNTGVAPWTIVEGVDPHYRSVTVGTTIRDALKTRLRELDLKEQLHQEQCSAETPLSVEIHTPAVPDPAPITIFSQLDLEQSLSKDDYREQLREYQAKLSLLHYRAFDKGISTIALFEGPDAAGKGGAIRRTIAALDPHIYQALPFAAPTDEELAQHYLWRFWRKLSRAGLVTIFDRSWYGRVLVERVEGFAREDEWRRAYAEINEFEGQLIEHGIVLAKLWIHIDQEEQLKRFNEREANPLKQWKLTDEDWRNRDKWDAYAQAAHDMIQYTSTRYAPWELVEGNDKRFARIKVLKALCKQLEAALEK